LTKNSEVKKKGIQTKSRLETEKHEGLKDKNISAKGLAREKKKGKIE